MKTVNQDPSAPVADAEVIQPVKLTPMPNGGTPSLITIPPQFATTLVWVAVGFALGVWLCNRKGSKSSIF